MFESEFDYTLERENMEKVRKNVEKRWGDRWALGKMSTMLRCVSCGMVCCKGCLSCSEALLSQRLFQNFAPDECFVWPLGPPKKKGLNPGTRLHIQEDTGGT